MTDEPRDTAYTLALAALDTYEVPALFITELEHTLAPLIDAGNPVRDLLPVIQSLAQATANLARLIGHQSALEHDRTFLRSAVLAAIYPDRAPSENDEGPHHPEG